MMKAVSTKMAWGCCLTALLAAPAAGQEGGGFGPETQQYLELAEDMEIMGRLLEEALELAYQDPKIQEVRTMTTKSGIVHAGVFEGGLRFTKVEDRVRMPLSTYVGGHGIVFQTESPVPRPEGPSEYGSTREACPFLNGSRWDQTRMRLEGGSDSKNVCSGCHRKTESVKVVDRSPRMPTTKQLVDTLIQVLAENGHNVRHLETDERVSVGILFRAEQVESAHSGLLLNVLSSPMVWDTKHQRGPTGEQVSGVPLLHLTPSSPRHIAGKGQEGELFLKAQEYKKAIKAFREALEEAGVKDPYRHPPDADQRLTYQKLLQAHVGADNLEEAEKLISVLRWSEEQDGADEKPAPPPLPSRLVVSATKAQLDGVAAGEISPEEFAQQVEVRFYEGRSPGTTVGLSNRAPSSTAGQAGSGTPASDERAGVEWKDLIDPETGGILYDARDSPPLPKR